MSAEHDHLETMAATLEASGRYRVLRKLAERPALTQVDPSWRVGLFVDVETTGLSAREHEIIELAMTRFFYTADDGVIHGLGESFQRFREPSEPISDEVTRITGITDAMVAGHTIDASEVASFAASASFVAAHNAAFDRRFLERFSDVFRTKPWACSMSQIDWAGEGYEGVKLSYLASSAGFFYDKHRAVHDCAAAIELLSLTLPSGATGLSQLLATARRPTWRVRAEGAPFELKDVLKARGYRWDDGGSGAPRAWYIDVDDAQRDNELSYLQREIYQREVELRPMRINAYDRFSDRC